MRMIKCEKHDEKFSIPTEEKEYLSGKYHQEIESCHLHHKQNPECRFIEVENK